MAAPSVMVLTGKISIDSAAGCLPSFAAVIKKGNIATMLQVANALQRLCAGLLHEGGELTGDDIVISG